MQPRDNQYQRPGASTGLPPSRRVGSIDGIGRPLQRPPQRPQLLRPPTVQAPVPAQPQQPVFTPLAPTFEQPTATPLVHDEVPLALAGPTPVAGVAAVPEAPPLSFTPPAPKVMPEVVKKRKITLPRIAWRKLLQRRVLIPIAVVATIALAGFGIRAGVSYAQTQASPATIYADALTNAMETQYVTVSKQVGNNQIVTTIDFAKAKSPVIAAHASSTIAGAKFEFNTYGTARDSYFSYTKLPAGLPTTTVSAIEKHWIQLRKNGNLPAGINTQLSNPADPRFAAFGPFLFANLDKKTGQKIGAFIADHKVYGYNTSKVTSVPLNGKNALLFNGKFDSGYAKVANQSLATSQGFNPSEVQRVVDSLTPFKDATSSLYIDAGSRLPLRLVLKTVDGQTISYDFSNINKTTIMQKPSSNIAWPEFATTQLQLEAQTSATQTADVQDNARQINLTNLQTVLQQYFVKMGYHPTLTNLNSQSWIAANLVSFDPDTTRDPQSASLALLAAPISAAQPPVTKTKAKPVAPTTPIYGYVYAPVTSTGKPCNNEATSAADQQCAQYTLLATLSDGKIFKLASN